MGPRLLFAFVMLFAVPVPAPAAEDPEFNGRKMSAWLDMLRDDALARKRRAAAIALGQIATDHKDTRQVILPVFAKVLRNDASAAVRGQIAVSFGQQGGECVPLFMSELAEAVRVEKDSAARREMAVALGRFGKQSRPAVVPLVEALKDPAGPARAAAADALGRIGPDAKMAVPALLPLVADADRGVRVAAVFGLGRLDPEDPTLVAAAFVKALAAEQVREAGVAAGAAVGSGAVWAGRRDEEFTLEILVGFGLLGDRSADPVAAATRSLADPAADVRRQAALTLGKFGPAARSAEKPLAAAFAADADKLVRIYALHALCKSFGTDAKDLIPAVTARLAIDPEYEVRAAAADELGAMGPAAAAAVPALRAAQRDPQIKVREAAAGAVKVILKPAPKPKNPS